MQPFISYILSFITGAIISYIFAKAKFDSPEFEIKAEALVKYKKIIEGERNELAIKLAKAEERAENARSSYNDIMPFLINMDLANKMGFKNITNDIKTGLGVLKTQAEQMKVQCGSALSDEAKSNAFITIPGLRGMAPKEISVKNLASIIQARMSEIMDFVTYHLKQVGLDTRMLNGGIILTGGGSQLKHLIQLTEYITGLNARIGYPNEHLAGGHIDELAKPMYSTCIGLILKGYNDYENKNKQFEQTFKQVTIPNGLQQQPIDETLDVIENETVKSKERKTLKSFMDGFKNGLIDLFKEEEDAKL